MDKTSKVIEVIFKEVVENESALLIAQLSEMAIGFEEDTNILKAYFDEDKIPENLLTNLAIKYNLTYEINKIRNKNWNAVWESNFEPVVIANLVGIRASFHKSFENVQHEIIITPKMSFGTGHHATTHLMIQSMMQIDFINKTVFDFGTGTGVLAIFAKKLGASKIVASDIDIWSIENARENFYTNEITDIELIHSGSANIHHQFDIILANINRNVLLENIPILSSQLKQTGHFILSGILLEDEEIITQCANKNGLQLQNKSQKEKWISLTLRRL